MQLRFELGDSQAPRGHAIIYAHTSGSTGAVLATYCVVLPIQFSIGKYLPPLFASQIPLEGLRDANAMSVVPIPPMLEDGPGLTELRAIAEHRGDDLCDLGTIFISDEGQRMTYAAEACAQYAQLFAEYSRRWPTVTEAEPAQAPLDELDVDAVMAQVMPERDRLAELARLIGQARYALDVRDTHQLDEVKQSMQRITQSLPGKYRADQLMEAALRTDAAGPRLAELYLQRAYKLLDEDYAGIPPIEENIRALRENEPSGGERSPNA
ncbi:MAG TPA: hypothetical protein VKQ30_15825 [Ktedonobacterales bacterium]|nr:hypothetical protein [Ktedonobacterales bacterium]